MPKRDYAKITLPQQLVKPLFRTENKDVENDEGETSNPHMLAMAVRMNRIKQRFKSLYQNSVGGAKVEKKESFRDTLPPISSEEE